MSNLTLTDFDRAHELDAAMRKQLVRILPTGAELVEGDFAEDEKWRIVQPEQAAPDPYTQEQDTPVIGKCHVCRGEIREHEPRIEDDRGLHHEGCYEQPEQPKRASRKAS